jgi:hypothetical protein
LEDWAPDAVVDWSSARVFDAGVYRGHREIRAFAEELLGTWDEVRIEIVDGPVGGPRRPLDRRERRLRAGTRRHRSSGPKRVADHDSGRRADVAHALPTKQEALEAAGLSESAMSHETVEIARKALEAFNRRDRDAWPQLMDPELE